MRGGSKNLLTREGCKKELARLFGGTLRTDIALLVVMLLIFIPLAFLAIYVGKSIFALGFVFTLLCACAPAVFVGRTVLDILNLRLIKKDCFSIEKDIVSRLAKGEMPRNYSEGRALVNVIYFARYGRYIASGIAFDLSSVGDEFYVVILHARKEKVLLAYHTMMYDVKKW